MKDDINFFQNVVPTSLSRIADLIAAKIYRSNLEITDAASIIISNVATLSAATNQDIAFFANPKYWHDIESTNAGACIISEKMFKEKRELLLDKDTYFLVVDDAYARYAQVMQFFYPPKKSSGEIDATAVVSDDAKLGNNVTVMAHAYIGKNAVIGDNVIIYPHVYIDDNVQIGADVVIYESVSLRFCVIGERTIIHPGTRIGQDGFGYATYQGKHLKIPQIGRVIIGCDVEIGANTAIDRGALEDTVIGDMSKIDNLVHIAHNVVVGRGCMFVGQVGVAGSTIFGDYVLLGGQVGIAGHLSIGNMVQVGAQAGVIKDIAAKDVVWGSPAMPIKEHMRQIITIKNLATKRS